MYILNKIMIIIRSVGYYADKHYHILGKTEHVFISNREQSKTVILYFIDKTTDGDLVNSWVQILSAEGPCV